VINAELLAAMLALLREVSATAIMPYYRALTEDHIENKATDDIVTVADKLAEEMLSDGLRRIADIAVVGEEAAFADPTVLDGLKEDCWIVDPIDGTSNFASGQGHFGIQVAMASGGMVHAGWIYDPRRERLLSAHAGKGAFCNGERIHARASGMTPPRLSAMTRFMTPAQRALFEADIAPRYTLAVAPGCAAEEYPEVAFGAHDLAIYERTLAWDHAPGCLFLNEAGGKCFRQDGTPYRVDSARKGMIAAATPQLWDEFVTLLQGSGFAPGA
jgi:fructose-1,6-bisphosphatase/inositol monophosphatase family enzyme